MNPFTTAHTFLETKNLKIVCYFFCGCGKVDILTSEGGVRGARFETRRKAREEHRSRPTGRGRCTHFMHNRSFKTIDPRIPGLQCRDEARRVFTDQADMARTKHEAP